MSEQNDESCWVYVIAKMSDDGPCSPVKVGISQNVDKRMSSIQTACPFPIALFYIFECPSRDIALEMERMFHETQNASCAHGEWFDFHPVIAVHLLCIAFRSAFGIRMPNNPDLDKYLDRVGVIWAEKKFCLAIPGERLQ